MDNDKERDSVEEAFNRALLTEDGEEEEVETIPPFLVEIWQDPDTESPNDYDGLFKLVSFSTSHNSFRDPSEIFGCKECGEFANEGLHGEPTEDTDPDDVEEYHKYESKEEVAFVLNYYEHGQCRWYVAPDSSPVDMQWDGVYGAGVLIFNVGDFERVWWDQKTDLEKRRAAESFTDEYTAWVNGETYGYTIRKQARKCECCGSEVEGENIDSCGGFIVGYDNKEYFESEILFSLADVLDILIPQVTDPNYESMPKLRDLIKEGEHFTYTDEFGGDWF